MRVGCALLGHRDALHALAVHQQARLRSLYLRAGPRGARGRQAWRSFCGVGQETVDGKSGLKGARIFPRAKDRRRHPARDRGGFVTPHGRASIVALLTAERQLPPGTRCRDAAVFSSPPWASVREASPKPFEAACVDCNPRRPSIVSPRCLLSICDNGILMAEVEISFLVTWGGEGRATARAIRRIRRRTAKLSCALGRL